MKTERLKKEKRKEKKNKTPAFHRQQIRGTGLTSEHPHVNAYVGGGLFQGLVERVATNSKVSACTENFERERNLVKGHAGSSGGQI